nr:sentrin-specific protease 7-like isoform X2 [Rhipicephalus microplus]
MDTSCSSPRQQQQHHHPPPHHHRPTASAVVIIDRSPARSTTTPSAVCRLTPSQQQQRVTVVGTQGQVSDASLYVVCSRCGQISHDLNKCDFCSRQISVADRSKPRVCGPKRRLNLDGGTTASGGSGSGAGSQQLQPTEAKITKRTFYGNDVITRPLLQTASSNNVLTVRQAVLTTNGQARPPLLSAVAAMPPAKPMRSVPVVRRTKREPECLTISISSDEEADADTASEECYQKVSSSETPTKENHSAPQPAAADVQCLERVQETPPESPRGDGRGAVVVVTSTHSDVPRSFGGSNSAAPTNSEMRFSCRSIRIGSYKAAPGEHWVTVSNRGISFTIQTPREGQELTLRLLESDVIQVLGNLSRNMAVLFVTTSRDYAAAVRTKLGMNRKQGAYYDPTSTEERQKWITFLPEPSFTEDQKSFLRQVFPGPLLHEIKQFQANDILIRSSPGPGRTGEVVATSAAPSAAQPQTSSAPTVTHVVIHSVPNSTAIVTRTTRSSSASSSAVAAVSSSSSVMATCEQGSSQEESSSGPNIKLLVYPAPPKTGGIPVHSADLRCLREGQFLNDVIIDFYLKYLLLERSSEEVRQRTHIFSSFFYPRLTQRLNPRAPGQQGLTPAARRHRNVRTWTRHVDIFAKDFIVVPINQNAHWFLAVLCFPGLVANVCPPQEVAANYDDHTPLADNQSPAASPKAPDGVIDEGESVLESDPDDGTELEETGSPLAKGAAEAPTERPYILILDSLRGGLCGRARIITTLREYLTEEWKAKKRTQLNFSHNNMCGYAPRTPQQGNYSDCGIYLLQYVESFLEKPPGVGDRMWLELENWFPEDRVAQKRAAIRDLILDLHLQQNPGSDFPKRWREEEEEEEAAALRVEEPVSTTVLVTPATSTLILVCPGNSSSQPS